MPKPKTKSAFISIVGKPNVGKSSLLNAFLGEKIAIVTSKPQTTRTRITGVLTKDLTQLVFIDTPGFHRPKTKLSDSMVKAVHTSLQDVDLAVLVVEPAGMLNESEVQLIQRMTAQQIPIVLVINKIDLLKRKEELAERIAKLTAQYAFDAVIPVSVLRNDGVDRVLEELYKRAGTGEHFFPDDTLTDQPERVLAAEMIREQLLLNLHQEIPHGTAVVIEMMREREDQTLLDIDAMIYCEKDSHKGMIIGKQGAVLKRVATAARGSMEKFFGIQVNLKCWVKVREDWRNKESFIKNFGLSDS